jgi:lycopene beta-cyclase
VDVDVAVVGAGGAGLSLVTQLDRAVRAAGPGTAAPSVVLVDPVHRRGADRTWCFWDGGRSDVEAAVHRSWSRVELVDRAGRPRVLDLSPLRYVMVRSADFYALAEDAARRLDVGRVVADAEAVLDGPQVAVVRAGGREIRARWVFDSRPAPPSVPPNTALLQHFRGWTVRFDAPVVDPAVAVLMDFSVPQPPGGVAFGYVLPDDDRRALVEYTLFSRSRVPAEAYEAQLRAYLDRRWPGVGHVVEGVEDGAIPMTDGGYRRRVGHRVFRLGTAGGATRASTGYTFAAMQRQAAAVARALVSGRDPQPPPAYPARHRWMDAVLLRALDRGHADGADLFVRLFARNPPQRVLRFLDGATGIREDLALMATAPLPAMTRATAGDVLARARRRAGRQG